jgi:hypothetical protein
MEVNLKVTDALSLYAAVLSTIVFVWNIRKAMPRFKVEVVYGTEKIDDKYVSGAYISIKNPSAHTIHLSNVSMLYKYKKTCILDLLKNLFLYKRLPHNVGWISSSLSNYKINDKCPLALESGKSIGILVPETVIHNILEDSVDSVIKISVQDELWRNKHSKKFKYAFLEKNRE